ncbi:MAG: hypothetical protein M3Q39_10220 [Actinomycetota bacterium]|nr:hypothetical protein [Actinomycetota bacterium]
MKPTNLDSPALDIEEYFGGEALGVAAGVLWETNPVRGGGGRARWR